jgi:hypothetical protein
MDDIIERLRNVFGWIEERDMRVCELWLHPKQVAELDASNNPGWDRVNQRAVMRAYLDTKGAINVGFLWGALVFESEIVVENHVAALPDGWEARLVNSSACMPF